ncbi:hypothetical protein OIA45_49190 (plasmid) [Streptomyces chartreusis]|uniref:hypothetical protein n=1 Tax=Streptomyces chartreusis TaxID=1969 RepID=UPI0037DC5379|nr:hypothetical protein OIA45_49190 [Streptomyces chartreusis]
MSLIDAVNNFEPLAGEPSPFEQPPRGTPWDTVLPFPETGTEAELADRVLARLEPWFHITREAPGQHWTGRTLYLDAILRPRRTDGWKNPQAALGLEFKRLAPGGQNVPLGYATGYAAQCIDYTQTEWVGYGRIPVFTCPGAMRWIGRVNDEYDYGAAMYTRLLGQFGVGELVLYWGFGLVFCLSGHPVWGERKGVIHGRNWGLEPRTGSR